MMVWENKNGLKLRVFWGWFTVYPMKPGVIFLCTRVSEPWSKPSLYDPVAQSTGLLSEMINKGTFRVSTSWSFVINKCFKRLNDKVKIKITFALQLQTTYKHIVGDGRDIKFICICVCEIVPQTIME